MKHIKYQIGNAPVHEVSEKDFKETTANKYPFTQSDSNGKSAYAYCPQCENSVKVLGIYKPLPENISAHARHTKKDISGFPLFDMTKYEYCPYHRKSANYVLEIDRKNATEEDIEILKYTASQYDRCIYLIRKSIGLVISKSFAEKMFISYVEEYGYMLKDRTRENIPWIVLSKMPVCTVMGKLVVKDSPLYKLLQKNKEIKFEKTDNSSYLRVIPREEKKFVNLQLAVTNYRFAVDTNEVLHDYIDIALIVPDNNGTYKASDEKSVQLDPFAFNKLVHANKEEFRDKDLISLAEGILSKTQYLV